MSSWDKQYLRLVRKVLDEGAMVPCRTGDNVVKCLNMNLDWDLADGFPILTFRPIPFKGMKAELSCFLQGITDKEVFVQKGCKYWNQWANPAKAPIHDKEAQEKERDLGPIYGWNYRHFGAKYDNYDTDYTGQGFDQLKSVINTLKTNPYDRRMIISAWDAANLDIMALPPCMYLFQFTYLNDRLHITAKMRSADLILGVPTDMMFASLLLSLVAKTVGMEPGTVNLSMTDCHIYENHIEAIEETFNKPTFELPMLKLADEADVFNFEPEMAELVGYEHGEKMTFKVAV